MPISITIQYEPAQVDGVYYNVPRTVLLNSATAPGPQGIPGPPGPQGPPGEGAATLAYVHDQISPSDEWNINHSLGYHPNVIVIDSGGNIVEGEVEYLDMNHMVIRFTFAFGGKAYLS